MSFEEKRTSLIDIVRKVIIVAVILIGLTGSLVLWFTADKEKKQQWKEGMGKLRGKVSRAFSRFARSSDKKD